MKQVLPFEIQQNENFFERLGDWIGDVFYDIFPESGLEIRDEQIFMAYQVERAFKEKKIIFAEAGVGTGKTFVYLLYALVYARYKNQPAIIACADETLIEQLVKDEGDIAKLTEILDIQWDVRLAKSQNQYLCIRKLEDTDMDEFVEFGDIHNDLPDFVHDFSGLQAFHPYGDRKNYPHLSDEQWNQISWDYFQDCSQCDKRHRCGLTLTRDHYRKAKDVIICSQDFYMEHIWTKESRKREGQMPLLPEASCVIFDEGHLVEFAAQKALTYRLKEHTLEVLLTKLLQNDVREELSYLLEDTLQHNQIFFDMLMDHTKEVEGSKRMEVNVTEELQNQAKKLASYFGQIGDALVFEKEMYTLNDYEVNMVDEYLDFAEYSVKLLCSPTGVITWAEEEEGILTLVIMPRTVEEVLQEKVFSKEIPYIFSSATMSEEGTFDYIKNSLGIKDALSFSVNSPFDYEEKMKIDLYIGLSNEEKEKIAFEKMKDTGSSLFLFNNNKEQNKVHESLEQLSLPFPVYAEGNAEISDLVSKFQNEVDACLLSTNLWEGLDVPGQSLSQLFIWDLPFPPNDPVFQAKRKDAKNPFHDVDVPYMLLRLRQGIGRLIRTSEDEGTVSIFIQDNLPEDVYKKVLAALPVTPTIHKK